MRRGILVLAAGAEWESAMLTLLEGAGSVVLLRRCVDIDDLLASLTLGQADGAVVSLDVPGLDADAVAQIRRAGAALVAVVPTMTEAAGARAARIGAVRTVEAAALATILDLLAEGEGPVPASAPDQVASEGVALPGERPASHRVLCICGTRGAPGASTVAVALAAVLSGRGEPVTLIDADPRGGTVAQQLGVLDEVSGLLAVARMAPTGEIGTSWLRHARTVAPSWLVVTGLPRADRWREIPDGALEELIDSAAQSGWVVLDAGDEPSEETLGAADEVIVVGSPDPVGLTRVCRTAAGLSEQVAAPVRVVVNRWRKTLATSESEVADLLVHVARPAAVHLLPEDRTALDRAATDQRSPVDAAPSSGWTQALGRFAEAIAPERRKPGLRRRTAGTARRR